MIEVRQLTKRFGHKTVLAGLDLHAPPGSLVALLGQNGSGKTTLLRILSGLLKPGSGQVLLQGTPLNETSQSERQNWGVVLHQPLLYEHLSATENLRFYADLYGLSQANQRIAVLLEQVGLERAANSLVRTYSRGMKQRLALARALLPKPQLLLLDEPYSGLDQESSLALNQLLQEELALGHTVLMTTHELGYALQVATRFDLLARGRIAASQPANQLSLDGLQAWYQQTLESLQANKGGAA